MRTMSSISTEYVWARISDETGADISTSAVELAVVAYNARPTEADWQTPDNSEIVSTSVVRGSVLVGPADGLALQPGSYRVWYRLTDAPEVPTGVAGTLVIT